MSPEPNERCNFLKKQLYRCEGSIIVTSEKNEPPIWETFCTAIGTEYREAKEICGASGISHPVEAIGVDDNGKRLVLISAEYNPRIAALMRVDVQATMADVKVLVARPLALDLAHTVRNMFFTDMGTIDIQKIMPLTMLPKLGDESSDFLKETYGAPATAALNSISKSNLPMKSHVLTFMEQITSIDWKEMVPPTNNEDLLQILIDALTKFSTIDNLAADRLQGICPLPTYELTDDDWDLFSDRKQIDEVQERLREMDVFQYFFPPADSLVLGLIDKGYSTEAQIKANMNIATEHGHMISGNALLPQVDRLPEMLEQLRDCGYIAEGEFANELTEDGESFRRTVSFRPSESLFHKLSRLMSVKVNLDIKDFFDRN